MIVFNSQRRRSVQLASSFDGVRDMANIRIMAVFLCSQCFIYMSATAPTANEKIKTQSSHMNSPLLLKISGIDAT